MSTDKITKVKTVLGIVAMTSLAALTPPADAKTLDSSQTFQNILRQAKLSLDNQNQQLGERSMHSSLKKIDDSFKTARPFCCNYGCGQVPVCVKDSSTGVSLSPNERTITATDDERDSRPKTGGCF